MGRKVSRNIGKKPIKTTVLWPLRTIKLRTPRTKSITFWFEISSTTKKLSIQTSIEKFLFLVTENYVFECRGKSKSRKSGLFGLLDFRGKDQMDGFSMRHISARSRIPIEIFAERVRPLKIAKSIWRSRRSSFESTLWNRHHTIRNLEKNSRSNNFGTIAPLYFQQFHFRLWGQNQSCS